MSTLEGAVPLGLGITKLRLWDELHRAHCETMHPAAQASLSLPTETGSYIDTHGTAVCSQPDVGNPISRRHTQQKSLATQDPAHAPSRAKKRRTDPPEPLPQPQISEQAGSFAPKVGHSGLYDCPTSFSDWFLSNDRGGSCSSVDDASSTSSKVTGAVTDSQGVRMPPPPPKPGPSRRKPPPLVARIKAKARRAKRKQQKAEYRRRLFLAHLVQVTREARQRNARSALRSASSSRAATGAHAVASSAGVRITKTKMAQQAIQQAWLLFPECLGVDLGSFVEVVFDTDAQSSEITAPSDISDDDLAKATRTEIENRKRLGGADVQVPKGVFRWMVARDFAQRWPQKMQHVRDNPWPGLELVWGSPSCVAATEVAEKSNSDASGGGDVEPIRWQSGRRSRFIRKKEGKVSKVRSAQEEAVDGQHLTAKDSVMQNAGATSSINPVLPGRKAIKTGHASMGELAYLPIRQATGQPSGLARPTVAGPLSVESTPRPTEAPANLKQRQDPFDLFPLTFEPSSGSWIRASAISCSYAASVPSDAASVPIRL